MEGVRNMDGGLGRSSSIGGFVLVLGMLVDDAVVVTENAVYGGATTTKDTQKGNTANVN